MTGPTDPAAVVREYWENVFVERDLDAIDALVTDPTVRHTAEGNRSFSPEEFKEHLRDALCAFRTEAVTFDHISSDGPNVWLRATVRAVSLATMTPMCISWLAQYRVEGGRIAEAWALHQTNVDWSL